MRRRGVAGPPRHRSDSPRQDRVPRRGRGAGCRRGRRRRSPARVRLRAKDWIRDEGTNDGMALIGQTSRGWTAPRARSAGLRGQARVGHGVRGLHRPTGRPAQPERLSRRNGHQERARQTRAGRIGKPECGSPFRRWGPKAARDGRRRGMRSCLDPPIGASRHPVLARVPHAPSIQALRRRATPSLRQNSGHWPGRRRGRGRERDASRVTMGAAAAASARATTCGNAKVAPASSMPSRVRCHRGPRMRAGGYATSAPDASPASSPRGRAVGKPMPASSSALYRRQFSTFARCAVSAASRAAL